MDVPLLSSVSVLALVGYVGVVIWRGNLVALFTQLNADKAFLYALVAIGILYYLAKLPEIGGPVRLIIGVALLALLLKTMTAGSVKQTFSDFQSGKATIADAFTSVAEAFGGATGLYPLNSAARTGATP